MRKKCKFLFSLISFFIFIIFPCKAWSSTQGKIEGVVTDSAGNPLENATVTIISQRTSTINYEVQTNNEGKFVQIGLAPGYYQVTFKKSGYITQIKEVKVSIEESTKIQVKLEKTTEFVERNMSEADRLFLKGNKFYAENKYAEATSAYEEAIKLNQNQWGYYFNLGLAYKKLDKKQEAKGAFARAVELNSESFSANKEFGEILAKSGEFEGAKKYYQKAVELSPEDPDASYNLGVCLLNTGESEAALKAFKRTIELKEDYAEVYYQIGTIYVGQNMVKEAVENLEKFLKLAPDHEKASLAKQLLEYLKQ